MSDPRAHAALEQHRLTRDYLWSARAVIVFGVESALVGFATVWLGMPVDMIIATAVCIGLLAVCLALRSRAEEALAGRGHAIPSSSEVLPVAVITAVVAGLATLGAALVKSG